MGVALYVTFERPIPKVKEWDACGKTLADNLDKLDRIAKKHNLFTLSEFISVSPEEVEDLLAHNEPGAFQKDLDALRRLEEQTKPSKKNKKGLAEIQRAAEDIEGMMDQLRSAPPVKEQWFNAGDGL